MAAGKKLLLSRLVRDLRLLYLFSRRKKVEERMSGVRGVPNYAGCFAEAAGSVDRISGWEICLHDGLGCIHDLL